MITFNADFLRGNEATKFKTNDIFDRVINLKITAGKDVYVIRSDFEIVYPNLDVTNIFKEGKLINDDYYIRKCLYKPSIKLQYNQVANNVNTKVDIYISNFFMLDKTGKAVMSFNEVRNKITNIEVMMGYFGQFYQMYKGAYENGTLKASDLFDFKPGYGVDVINISVDYVTTDKLPPDSILHIHGYIGIPYSSAVGEITDTSYESLEAEGVVEKTIEDLTFSKATYIERMFYQHITRRFRREEKVPEGEDADKVRRELALSPLGRMSPESADKYGIRVFCSEGVKALSNKDIQLKITGGNDKLMDIEVYFAAGYSAVSTFNNINTALGGVLVRRQLINGNWIVFTKAESEDPDTLKEKFELDDMPGVELNGIFFYKNILPAIYNINVGAVTNIVAPFFYFINPFETIYFKSRYKETSLVSYYTNIGEGAYTVTKQQVSFATVENINEMSLLCTNK